MLSHTYGVTCVAYYLRVHECAFVCMYISFQPLLSSVSAHTCAMRFSHTLTHARSHSCLSRWLTA